ncbi:MAG: XRE family transcriptional regulator [Zymomonas mobilis subsp. pomaceae]|uniref:XRE family transcriptional regulator n=1 Tax=Zymomonas mobilis TaxID=542 RepID=UPI0002F08F66|nr:XRE family transcriptional regulator [Zymomonas mobilis]MDX5948806.1 XRE family transcriptional regulator [Zymomonas mobilis subsp. pomaceae]GEB88614.1 hypothetical protein ZMO02_02510 [Zymomonas mobilis subsp. pomaceae]
MLRKAADPPITIRALAEALGMPPSSYAFYEDMNRFKKNYLPIELSRKLATVLMRHNIDPADVFILAGLTTYEAETEISAIKNQPVPIQFVQMNIALPDETLLTDMFENLLSSIDMKNSKKEIAHLLAKRLPDGLSKAANKVSKL